MCSINSGEDDDTWDLLQENKDLDFTRIRALARVSESSVEIEEYIRDVLGDPDMFQIMTNAQIFGAIFSRCPPKLNLSPVCKQIVDRWQISSKGKPLQTKPGSQQLHSKTQSFSVLHPHPMFLWQCIYYVC
uniref:Uncharacterized protein n=1 Tax=Daphnia galeata TaxID=27404 RepID=A0A8J2REF9_9CRUS|nr:unnamed protein product [Daphnia galeata]